ncbi:Adenosylhomocysteinase [[Actinomadura] parvosata subsp. kistnae]|uniref:Nudix hydrolase domain-containing protein n=1 Tax=[Actinomadura] parvosata subsp. kistnae TaxID=1909395 RepID=A0A1V0A7K5_9ACTN|nr:NUDIX domain-containing protein [Nonomuraea sp. ATCC 55076]AQZ66197.1 hypothetical protein BKM31_36300 [Nonomuraea sp. ATCC 55076]SPL97706.1 Adenosylhomocysteinase [Actinomadura parvosata subsp. kistnae]
MTVTREEIGGLLARYLDVHPASAPEVAHLVEALAGGQDLAARTTTPLHVTVSAAVLNDAGRVLMVHHRTHGRWLLPGGHLEPEDDSLFGAALRELEEETGIPGHQVRRSPPYDTNHLDIPVDVDVHEIVADAVKGEPAHLHADFRFVCWGSGLGRVRLQTEEVAAFAWREVADLQTARLSERVAAMR